MTSLSLTAPVVALVLMLGQQRHETTTFDNLKR